MPRKAKSPAPPKEPAIDRQPYLLDNDAPWGGFINIRLTDEQKDEFSSWYEENSEHVGSYFEEIIGAGIKASFSYDAEHECCVLAVTGALVSTTPGSRFCSTSRAATLADVTALTVWKHLVMARGDYGNYRPKDGSFMSWG